MCASIRFMSPLEQQCCSFQDVPLLPRSWQSMHQLASLITSSTAPHLPVLPVCCQQPWGAFGWKCFQCDSNVAHALLFLCLAFSIAISLPVLSSFLFRQLGPADLLTKSLRLQLLTLQQMLSCSELGGHEAVLGLPCLQGCFQAGACHFLLFPLLPAFRP